MPLLDNADLLARCQRLAQQPAASEWPQPADWYAWLTEAQLYWQGQLGVHVPEKYYQTVLLTTADGGASYSFPAEPLGAHIEVRDGRQGRIMAPGPDWDPGCDFVIAEDGKIRFPGGKSKIFGAGLYARYIPMTDVIDAATQPTLSPTYARLLLPARACYLWASSPGSLADPQVFLNHESKLWAGDPDKPGDVGVIGQLKHEFFLAGAAAMPQGSAPDWWRSIDTGAGYVPQI